MPKRPPAPTRRERIVDRVAMVAFWLVAGMLVLLMFGVFLAVPPSFWAALDLR
jgi:hypothetical protein